MIYKMFTSEKMTKYIKKLIGLKHQSLLKLAWDYLRVWQKLLFSSKLTRNVAVIANGCTRSVQNDIG